MGGKKTQKTVVLAAKGVLLRYKSPLKKSEMIVTNSNLEPKKTYESLMISASGGKA